MGFHDFCNDIFLPVPVKCWAATVSTRVSKSLRFFQHLSAGISNLAGLEPKVLSILNAFVNTLIFVMALRDEQLSSPFYKWEIRRTGMLSFPGTPSERGKLGLERYLLLNPLCSISSPVRFVSKRRWVSHKTVFQETQFQMNKIIWV